MRNLWNREPALILGAVQTLLALAVAFGLHLTPEQVGAVMAAAAAVVALITRRTVTSPATAADLEGPTS
jgi:hypothetical protein